MTAPAANSTTAQKQSPGPLATDLMDRGQILAWMADADLGRGSIKWTDAAEERTEFCISKDLETTICYSQEEQVGVHHFSTAAHCGSIADAKSVGIDRATNLSKVSILTAFIQNTIKTEGGRKTFAATAESEIEFPGRMVVSYSHRGCGNCGSSGAVYCGKCNGNGQVPCPDICNFRGYRRCSGCGGSKGHRTHDGTWINCGYCGGYGEHLCHTCGGHQYVRCNGCGGTGEIRCNPCAGQGYFTNRYEIYGKTRIKTRSSANSVANPHTGLLEAWSLGNFSGANQGGSSPTVASQLVNPGVNREGKNTCTIEFKGKASAAMAVGDLTGTRVIGSAILLDKKHFRFTPFLNEKISAKIDEALADATGPKSIAEGVSRSQTLKELVNRLAKTSAAIGRFEKPTGEIDKIISSITSELDGSVENKSLAPLAIAYSASKQDFSGRIWRKAWTPFLIKLLPLTFLYVFLNLPYRIKEALGAKDLSDDATFWSFLLLAAVVAIPTGLAIKDVIVNLKKELGDNAKLSSPYHNGYFAAAGIAALLLAAYGSASTYVQGPKLDGMYLSQFGLWRTPTANAAPQKRAEEPDTSLAKPDPATAHLNGTGPASSKAGVPKQAASQKAANPTGSGTR